MQRCLHQIFRSKIHLPPNMRASGYGDCFVCTTDENNKWCAGYRPIALFEFEVKGETNELGREKVQSKEYQLAPRTAETSFRSCSGSQTS